jgi:hypothetical protein
MDRGEQVAERKLNESSFLPRFLRSARYQRVLEREPVVARAIGRPGESKHTVYLIQKTPDFVLRRVGRL